MPTRLKKPLESTITDPRVYLCHLVYPSLQPGRRLTVDSALYGWDPSKRADRRAFAVHSHQGALDGACGAYCLLMALTVLGHQPPSGWVNVLARQPARYKTFAELIAQHYFAGMDSDDIVACIEQLPFAVDYTVSRADTTRGLAYFCLDALSNDSLVILGTTASAHDHGHWTLVVGWEARMLMGGGESDDHRPRQRQTGARALLCIDPSEPAPTLSAFNARIDVVLPSAKAAESDTAMHTRRVPYMDSQGQLTKVQLVDAIAVRSTTRSPHNKRSARGRSSSVMKASRGSV
jgi:hypothetical protein